MIFAVSAGVTLIVSWSPYNWQEAARVSFSVVITMFIFDYAQKLFWYSLLTAKTLHG
jgi:hypothetical protein